MLEREINVVIKRFTGGWFSPLIDGWTLGSVVSRTPNDSITIGLSIKEVSESEIVTIFILNLFIRQTCTFTARCVPLLPFCKKEF